MTYVGATPTTGDFKVLDSITTSSATTFNLRQGGVAVYPQSANHCLVVLNGVLQTAGSSFNIVNDTIVFASSLASSDVINQILVLGNVNDIGVPSDDTVSTAKLQSSSVTDAKISAMASSKLTGVVPTARLGTGTASSSTVLYGDQTFKTAPSGTHVLLDDTYISSSTATITYSSSLITDTYEQYIITGSAIQMGSNSNGNLFISLSDDNGSSYFTGSSDYARGLYVLQSGNSSNTIISRMGDQNGIYLSGANYDYGGGTAYGNMGFVIRFLNLRNLATGSSARRLSIMDSVYLDRSSGNYANDRGFHYFKGGTGSINNIKISVTDSNTIGEGEFRLYGVA